MMTKKISTAFGKGVLSPILVLLVSGSLCLAVIDKENRPAYFDMVKVAVGYSFGAMRLPGSGDSSNQNEEEDKQPDEQG
ncbi:hypothetical protein H6G04_30190 [Calothrix membranacea FACHB-236]|nr:hypothetical protein [Calothrix membranacea FACHB-236]